MGYYAYDANGYLGDLASNGGWATFVRWAARQSGPVRALVEKGFTDSLAELAAALTNGPTPPSDAEEVWVGLKDYASWADAVLIATDGVGFEDESATGPDSLPTPDAPSRFADWVEASVTIYDPEGYEIEVVDGEWRRKLPLTEESSTGPDVVPTPEAPSRFADWVEGSVTFYDSEGCVIEGVDGEWRRKLPWTKKG